ncbi:hypothetical protein NDU88_003222 [Pleurodeles waltl]|uniref:Uncharacterized protein n=1 Tax=Pleurodeles waltl TaxID=8319 RepID=A0AAV7WNI2_PLEWA|nr:hypothetical protein NDU88_003222 [Pleurodeles waltl]
MMNRRAKERTEREQEEEGEEKVPQDNLEGKENKKVVIQEEDLDEDEDLDHKEGTTVPSMMSSWHYNGNFLKEKLLEDNRTFWKQQQDLMQWCVIGSRSKLVNMTLEFQPNSEEFVFVLLRETNPYAYEKVLKSYF